MSPPPPAESLAAADAVLLAEVADEGDPDARGRVRVELAVERWFKGDGGARAVASTAASTAACGFPFAEGERYLIYASERNGVLLVSLCSRTRPAGRAAEDIEELERALDDGDDEGEDDGRAATPTGEAAGAGEGDAGRDDRADVENAADSPGDLGGRSSDKGRGCRAAPGAGAGGALFAAAVAAALRRRHGRLRASKSRATELMQ